MSGTMSLWFVTECASAGSLRSEQSPNQDKYKLRSTWRLPSLQIAAGQQGITGRIWRCVCCKQIEWELANKWLLAPRKFGGACRNAYSFPSVYYNFSARPPKILACLTSHCHVRHAHRHAASLGGSPQHPRNGRCGLWNCPSPALRWHLYSQKGKREQKDNFYQMW